MINKINVAPFIKGIDKVKESIGFMYYPSDCGISTLLIDSLNLHIFFRRKIINRSQGHTWITLYLYLVLYFRNTKTYRVDIVRSLDNIYYNIIPYLRGAYLSLLLWFVIAGIVLMFLQYYGMGIILIALSLSFIILYVQEKV